MKKGGRRAERRIVDIDTHPASTVCVAVAADWLGLSERTVIARIEEGKLHADRDGKVYRIDLGDLQAYARLRREAS